MPFIKLRKLPSMPSFCHDRILDFFFFLKIRAVLFLNFIYFRLRWIFISVGQAFFNCGVQASHFSGPGPRGHKLY